MMSDKSKNIEPAYCIKCGRVLLHPDKSSYCSVCSVDHETGEDD